MRGVTPAVDSDTDRSPDPLLRLVRPCSFVLLLLYRIRLGHPLYSDGSITALPEPLAGAAAPPADAAAAAAAAAAAPCCAVVGRGEVLPPAAAAALLL
mgnify:CR=1 FL=1